MGGDTNGLASKMGPTEGAGGAVDVQGGLRGTLGLGFRGFGYGRALLLWPG